MKVGFARFYLLFWLLKLRSGWLIWIIRHFVFHPKNILISLFTYNFSKHIFNIISISIISIVKKKKKKKNGGNQENVLFHSAVFQGIFLTSFLFLQKTLKRFPISLPNISRNNSNTILSKTPFAKKKKKKLRSCQQKSIKMVRICKHTGTYRKCKSREEMTEKAAATQGTESSVREERKIRPRRSVTLPRRWEYFSDPKLTSSA